MNLITDRSEADIARLNELSEKGLKNMTAAEITEWLGQSKGAYNHTDLNRVETAVEYLRDRFAGIGIYLGIVAKKDWSAEMYPTREEMERYLENVSRLRSAISVPDTTADVPISMDYLTIDEANDIERILTVLDTLISNMIEAYFYAADLYAGEV